MKINKIETLIRLWLIGVLFLGVSCSKDEVIPEDEIIEEEEIVENSLTYIYDVFNDHYFWLDEVPKLDPNTYSSNEELVDALRYDKIDRWSFVADLDAYLALYEEAETKGYGVGMSLDPDNKLMVRFTYKNAPMGLAGVDRGWEIHKINDTAVTDLPDILGAFDTDSPVKFTFVDLLGDTVSRTMTRTDYNMNTVLHTSVIETESAKVGYLVFESFLDPSEAELNEAFTYFKEQNISELIVDLRYNGGGSFYIAYQLAGLIGGDDILNKPLASFVYNSKHTADNETYGYYEMNAHSVNLDRLFFITTESSASASEFVINSMFPYKEVILVGEKTHGKPVGMQVFASEDYNLALAPVTFQIVNANENGHYFNGVPVDYPEVDDIYHAWGDPEEACLKQALNIIEGNDVVVMKSAILKPRGLPLKRGLQEITGAY